eukprot:4591078-Amphidinium_carterae.1
MGIEVPRLTTWVQVLPQQLVQAFPIRSDPWPCDRMPPHLIETDPNLGNHATLGSVVHYRDNRDDP